MSPVCFKGHLSLLDICFFYLFTYVVLPGAAANADDVSPRDCHQPPENSSV